MTYSAPTLPHPTILNSLNHISAPAILSFDAKFSFSNLLPSGTTLPSSWGSTRYYDFLAPSPSSRRILIVHGGGTCAIGMAPLARLLSSAGNHVVIYDLYGHGLSSTPLTAHTPALMHMQILELLSHLGWSKVHLVGYSMGGSIVMSFSALHVNAVESVIALAPAGLWRKSERTWWERVSTDGYGISGFEWLRRSKILSYIYGSNPVLNEDWRERMMKGDIDTVPIQKWEIDEHKGFVASLSSLWNYVCFDQQESWERVKESRIEVLVVLGGKDGIIEIEHTRRELGKMGWKGGVEVVESATHDLPRVQRKEVADLCVKFWEGLEK